MRITHVAENVISSKSTKVISAVEKGEIADSIFYQHWMFSSKYLTIVAKIRAVVVTTRADGDHWR